MFFIKMINSALLGLIISLLPFTAANIQSEDGLKDFVFVEGGTFVMGDGTRENNPPHEVLLSDYYMCVHEVTFSEWKEFTDDILVEFDWDKVHQYDYFQGRQIAQVSWADDFPICYVTWLEAIMYCNWLSERHGLKPVYTYEYDPSAHVLYDVTWDRSANGYRLPTEAEWEYAAIGGKKSQGYKYAGSDNIDEVAWYYDNSGRTPHPVKSKKPNELGIYDMTGNVREWCWDYFDINYYNVSPPIDPTGPDVGYGQGKFMSFEEERQAKSVRGGGADIYSDWSIVSYRMASSLHDRGSIGIRLVRNVQ